MERSKKSCGSWERCFLINRCPTSQRFSIFQSRRLQRRRFDTDLGGAHTQKMGKRLNQSKDESLFRHRLSTCGHLCICYIHRDNSRLGCGRGGGGCRAQHASCFSFPLLWCRPSRSPMSTNRKWAKGDPTGGKWLHPPEAPVFSFDLDEEKIDRTDGQL